MATFQCAVVIINVTKHDKITCGLNLPPIATYNMRSVFPKISNLKDDILERSLDCVFLVEIWQKKENKMHQYEIEKMLEMNGLKYISTVRPTGWGGAAILVNQEKFSLEQLNISIPHNLEVIWGLLKVKAENAYYKKIIVCSFYSPPKSRKNSKLTDHLVTTLHMLKTQYPDCPIILGADKNDMDIKPLLNCGLKLRNIVDLPTRQGKILDILLLNIPQLYNCPIIIPPVPCDDPTSGKPSDHSVPVSYPHTDRSKPPARRYKTVTTRPLSVTGMTQFGNWIVREPLKFTKDDILPSSANPSPSLSPSNHAKMLEDLLTKKLDEFLPQKIFKVSSQDKKFINFELKKLHRQKQRQYQKNGKCEKYDQLKATFDVKYREASAIFLRDKVDSLKECEPGKAYKILKNMGAQPGDCEDNHTFSLPNHLANNLSDQQSAECIADHFASISNEYKPLDLTLLPDRVKIRLSSKSTPPTISEYECYEKLVKANKPQSGVPGDLPAKVVKEHSVELAGPLHSLLNNIVQTATWPTQWKMEYVTPIGKIPLPETEDDLRPIALTAFFSKVMESFIVMWRNEG